MLRGRDLWIVTSTLQKRNNLIIIFMDALRLLRFVYCPRIGEIALREETRMLDEAAARESELKELERKAIEARLRRSAFVHGHSDREDPQSLE